MSLKFFCETAYYEEDNEIQKERALEYLNFWKENLLYKLHRDTFSVKIVDEQWVDRDSMHFGILTNKCCLSLKICLEAQWNFELR